MQNELPIILASHGPFAEGVLGCVEMLMGKQENIEVITLDVDSHMDDVEASLHKAYSELNQGQGVLIFVDMLGGTPCNLASKLTLSTNDVQVYAGVNIPVMLEVLANRDVSLTEMKTIIEEVFPHSFINVNQALKMNQSNDEDEQL